MSGSSLTITFEPNGENATADPAQISDYTFDLPINILATATRKGYGFKGWTTTIDDNSNYVEKDVTLFKEITGDTTLTPSLYAQWEANTYQVTFDANSGLFDSDASDTTITIIYDKAISQIATLPAPVRMGYAFRGWMTLPDSVVYTHQTTYKTDGDMTLYARWEAKDDYTITFDPKGGTVDPNTIEGIIFDSPISSDSLPVPVRPGYKFEGWNDEEYGSGETYTHETRFTKYDDFTLYAQWTAKSDYVITFNSNGEGSSVNPTSKEVTFDAEVGELPDPTRTGYNFTEWNTLQDGTGETYTEETIYIIDGNLTLYAQWDAKTGYTITFDPNGDESATVDPTSKTATFDAAVGNLPDPTRTGYEFYRWNTEQDGTGMVYTQDTIYRIDGDITLYAQWDANEYTITFDPTGGVLAKDDSTKTVTYDSPVGNLPWPERAGYVFQEIWNTLEDGSGDTYTENTTYKIDGNITLFAMWRGEEYSLKFNVNGDDPDAYLEEEGEIITYTVTFGSPVEELAPFDLLPEREHYFSADEWNTKPDGTGETYTPETIYLVQGHTTLYAQWTGVEYTLNFDKNDGTTANNPQPRQVRYGSPVGDLPEPSLLPGYTFESWNTLPDGQGDLFDETTLYFIGGDTTLYAQWRANNYTITLHPNEGTVNPVNITVTYNTEIGELPVPIRAGYAFTGWNKLQSGEGDAHTVEMIYQWTTDTIFYAQWRLLSDTTDISDILVNNKNINDSGGSGGSGGGSNGNNLNFNISDCFLLECNATLNSALITINTVDPKATIIYNGQEITGNSFEITFGKFGLIPVTITIKAEAGNTRDTSFCIARRFSFDDVVITRWDNTMTVINNPLNNGGFHFNTYQWHESPSGLLVGDRQFYSAGQSGRPLNPGKEYYVVLTADEFEGELATCPGKPVLKRQPMTIIYPNPVRVNATLTVEIDDELLNTGIEIYSVSGALLKREKAIDRINTFNLPYPAGIYLVKVNGQTTTIIVE
jgi:uncharacterized repeat protein (TIGR02543 family)